ncbi:MAG: hypothetical protein HOV87_35795 [Catenulispora sp.]|nr:hypothetical protein [Catenulispora sp.]
MAAYEEPPASPPADADSDADSDADFAAESATKSAADRDYGFEVDSRARSIAGSSGIA